MSWHLAWFTQLTQGSQGKQAYKVWWELGLDYQLSPEGCTAFKIYKKHYETFIRT